MQHEGKIPKKGIIAIVVAILIIMSVVLVYFLMKPAELARQSEPLDAPATQEGVTRQGNGDFIYSPPEESIAFDKTECAVFYDDVLIAYLVSEVSDEEAAEIASTVDGLVAGHLSGSMNVLQIKVKPTGLQELEGMAAMLMESEHVIYATYDTPVILSEKTADGNPWSGNGMAIEDRGNEESPGGNDWWAEAIGAYSAWDFVDRHEDAVHKTTVGIFDSGFDADHEDLRGKMSFPDDYQTNTESDHGTHVAGIIGATNNDIGIRGVADRADLIGVDWSPATNDSESAEYVSLLSSGEYAGIIKSLIENDAKVINCSWGSNQSGWDVFLSKITNGMFDEPSLYEKAWESYRWNSVNICVSMMLQLFLNDKADFLIVQSAGNGYDNTGIIGYDASLTSDFCALTEDAFRGIEQNYSIGIITRNWMEKVDFTYENFKNHILIVGSVENKRDEDGNYKMVSGSNYGNVVDICAPGNGVFSMFAGDKYGNLSGTSMAAPMVSGAAALVWSVSPELSAAEVKQALRTNIRTHAVGVGGDAGTLYPMLNIGVAVRAVSPIDYDNLVTDSYYEAYEDEYGSYEWHVPKINLKSGDADVANSEIWEYAYVNGVEMNHEAISQDYAFVEYDIIEYDWAVNGDVLSLWLHTGAMSYAWDDYSVYNFSVSTGEKLSREKLIQDYGITIDRYNELAEQALGSAFWSNWTRDNENFKQASFIEWYNQALEDTISKANVNESFPYINGNGQLCMIAKIYSIAGADYYLHDLNLEDFVLVEDYAQPAEFNGQLIGVLNYIVGDWTDGSTEYRIFADERFEDNIIHITNGKVMFRTNIESGTVVVTGEASANLAPYVQPGALQSWRELKYDPTSDTIYVGNDSHPYYRMSNWISGNTPDVKYNDPDDGTSGVCGDNVAWRLTGSELTIGGTGPMTDYTTNLFTPAPWYSMNNNWIESVNILDGVTHIGNLAFDDCKKLKSLYIPLSVASIGSKVLDGCDSISDIYYAGSEAQWAGIRISDSNFPGSATLHFGISKGSEVDLPEVPAEKKYGNNVTWTISDGVLRATGVGKMVDYVSTAYVPWYDDRSKVTTVIMEGTITSVGSYAFDGFGKMTNITLPDTIRSIGEFAFWRCDDLSSIVIPNGCTVIGNNSFNWCERLESITLPASITEIQWNAFANCEDLSDVYYAGTEQQWQNIAISRTGNEGLLSATVHYNSSDPRN